MTPHEAWQLPTEAVPAMTDEVLLLRIRGAIERYRGSRNGWQSLTNVSYPEALKRPACVAKLVEWKLQGLI